MHISYENARTIYYQNANRVGEPLLGLRLKGLPHKPVPGSKVLGHSVHGYSYQIEFSEHTEVTVVRLDHETQTASVLTV